MADGKTHFNSNLILCVPISLIGGYYSYILNNPDILLYTTYGNLLGLFLTPDMDQPGSTYTENLVRELIIKLSINFLSRKKSIILGKFIKRIFMTLSSGHGS